MIMVAQIKPSIETKQCSRCNVVLPLTDFAKDKYKKSGRTADCLSCRRAVAKKRREDPEELEKLRRRTREYYHRNKEKAAASYKRYYEANREKRLAYHAEWSRKNKKSRAARMVEYRKRNPNVRKDWAKANPEKQAALYAIRRSRKKGLSIWLVKTKEIVTLYSQSCLYCGSTADIQIDHVIPLSRGGNHSIGNLAPACKKCNLSKKDKFVMEWKYDKSKS